MVSNNDIDVRKCKLIIEESQFKNFRWCELYFNGLRTNRFWEELYHERSPKQLGSTIMRNIFSILSFYIAKTAITSFFSAQRPGPATFDPNVC